MQVKKGFRQMLAEAEAEVRTLSAQDAVALHGSDDVVFVDLRDPRELDREGRMPGAFLCTRGMLEFWIDPDSPYHKPVFAEDKQFVFFCAGGWRQRAGGEDRAGHGAGQGGACRGRVRRVEAGRRPGGTAEAAG